MENEPTLLTLHSEEGINGKYIYVDRDYPEPVRDFDIPAEIMDYLRKQMAIEILKKIRDADWRIVTEGTQDGFIQGFAIDDVQATFNMIAEDYGIKAINKYKDYRVII